MRADEPQAGEPHPPIAIPFTLTQAGAVTLVIEDEKGDRVRNLIAETEYPAGESIAWWDGLDDLAADQDAAKHASFHIAGKLVAPGTYRVRGLVRPKLDIVYEMTANSNGNPAWATEDKASQWLANHTAPSAVLFVPEANAPARPGKPTPGGQILVGSFVSEGGSGLAWLDLNGNKVNGQLWIGGAWTAATEIARDEGEKPVPGVYAYTGCSWHGDKDSGFRHELRLNELVADNQRQAAPADSRMGSGEDRRLLTPNYRLPVTSKRSLANEHALSGLAVRNGLLVAAVANYDELVFVDAAGHKALGAAPLADPRGVAFDKQGRLIALSGNTLVRISLPGDLRPFLVLEESEENPVTQATPLPAEQLITKGLEDPQQVALDGDGNIYISDWGTSHQVKVFSANGRLLHIIGDPGKPSLGPYNPKHMNHPYGLTISGDGHLWVAENDKTPKRLSVWSLDGKLVHAFYGPSQYGGGGTVDSLDKTRFFYGDEGGGMEMKLDFDNGTSVPVSTYYRPELSRIGVDNCLDGGYNSVPQTPIHFNGRTYLTDCYTDNATNGESAAAIWLLEAGVARPVAAVGQVNSSPLFGMNATYSVRWTGQIVPSFSETYTFQMAAEKGARLWIDGREIINDWEHQPDTIDTGTIALEAGKCYDIKIEYNNNRRGGSPRAALTWSSAHQKKEVVPKSALFSPGSNRPTGTGLSGDYFEGANFAKFAATHVDAEVNFSWGKETPAPMITDRIKLFLGRLPPGTNLNRDRILFAWSDLNDDGQIQPEELTFANGDMASVCVMDDFTVADASGKVLKTEGFTRKGAPIYDASKIVALSVVANARVSSGCGQALLGKDGSLVLTTAPKPFTSYAIGGLSNDGKLWSYPNLWPGLHASHNAAMPEFRGELIGTTRLIGLPFAPGGEAGELFAINGNKGNVYLMTVDGLFVATLFRDCRTASWNAPEAKRGMLVNDLSLQEESFWPSITQGADGSVYMQAIVGCVLRVNGLDKIKRIPSSELVVNAETLQKATMYFRQCEAQRQATDKQRPALIIGLRAEPPALDGRIDEWAGANWVTVSQQTAQIGDWGHRVVKTEAALRVSGGRLFVAVRTDNANLLSNSGESFQNLFKTGGCIDLMIGADANADPKRKQAVAGDERLLVTRVKNKTAAVLYRPVAPGEGGERVAFSSPLRTIKFDRVDDVSADVVLASGVEKDAKLNMDISVYQFSIPLEKLGLNPVAGQSLRGDIGILSGDGVQTFRRSYWANKATGLTSDLPSEAELTPQLWGGFQFETER